MKKRNQVLRNFFLLGLGTMISVNSNAQAQGFRANQELAGKFSDNVNELLEHNEDSRERFYYYEVLHPVHEKKAKVDNGWASQRYEEKLNRGIIATPDSTGKVYVSWRLLKTDDPSISFNLYKSDSKGKVSKLNSKPITATTDFLDAGSKKGQEYSYWVKPVVNKKELDASEKAVITSDSYSKSYYKSIKLQGDYQAQRIGVCDLNGDGVYDFLILQGNGGLDPGGMSGNTSGLTYKLEAYLNNGTFLWRKDLGLGLEPGVWYTPYVVYDFDGDGKAEVAVKTGPSDVREADGRVRKGPEYCSVLDGMTGEEKARADWPARNPRFGGYNRTNRNQMGMAYLDGKTPCIIVARGTYKLMVVDAYQMKDGKLQQLWHWDGDEENPIIRSQGAHSLVCADIDGDGRDEVILGSAVLDDNGTCLYSTGVGHTDNTFLADIDPSHPGLEIFNCAEQPFIIPAEPLYNYGISLVDAKTGEKIWGMGGPTYHVGSGVVVDIDPSQTGLECIGREDSKADPKGQGYNGNPPTYVLNSKGKKIDSGDSFPGFDNWVYWDADKMREIVTNPVMPRQQRPSTNASAPGQQGPQNIPPPASGQQGPQNMPPAGDFLRMSRKASINKYKGAAVAKNIEGNISIIVDIAGDWREELITSLSGEIRIYSTTIPAKDRRISLMQDPLYRNGIVARTMGYTQPPMTSYYLGE
jgi:rhamnogalacturonan endolyase